MTMMQARFDEKKLEQKVNIPLQSEIGDLEQRYYDLYNLAPVAFLTISEDGTVKHVNQTAEMLLGYEPNALINSSIADYIYKADYTQFITNFKLLFATGSRQTFELRFLRSDDEVIWVQVVAALMGSDLAREGWFALNDITVRKTAENETLLSEQAVEAAAFEKRQLNELQSHLKPHFMFNALSGVIAMCYTDEAMAAELLTKFSRYLRLTLSVGEYEDGVTVHQTLELIEMYTEIEKSRFGERLKVIVEVEPDLMDTVIIPLVVQPLVENALRHGVLQKIEGGTVHLRMKRKQEYIEIFVCDNGVGMTKEKINSLLSGENSPVGVCISSIDQRVFQQSGKHLKIRSTKDVGTIVRVMLPLKFNKVV